MPTSTALQDSRSRQQSRPATQRDIATYFHTECSVCGRQLRVLVEHLGQTVACGHCGSDFLATDPASNAHGPCSVLEKANQLLVLCSNMRLA